MLSVYRFLSELCDGRHLDWMQNNRCVLMKYIYQTGISLWLISADEVTFRPSRFRPGCY